MWPSDGRCIAVVAIAAVALGVAFLTTFNVISWGQPTETYTIVIGAGIMGSASAYQLAKMGKKVLVLEQYSLVHDKGSLYGKSRIIRYAHGDAIYMPLIDEADNSVPGRLATMAANDLPYIMAATSGGILFFSGSIAGFGVFILMFRESQTMVIVSAVLLSDAALGLTHVIFNLDIMHIIAGRNAVSRSTCAFSPLILVYVIGQPLSSLMPLALSIERIIAVMQPLWYCYHGNRLSYRLIGVTIIIITVWTCMVIAIGFIYDNKLNEPCRLDLVIGVVGRKIFYFVHIALTFLSVVAYIPVIRRLKKPIVSVSKIAPGPFLAPKDKLRAKVWRNHISRVNRSAILNALNMFFLCVIPNLYIALSGSGQGDILTAIATILLTVRGMVSIGIFMLTNRQLLWHTWKKRNLLKVVR